MVSCRGSMAKAILCTLNLAFIFLSLAIILFGLQIQVQTSAINHQQQLFIAGMFPWRTASTFFILFGFFVGIISMFGFGAALCESTMLLNIYVYFLTISLVGAMMTSTMFFIFNNQLIFYGRHHYTRMMSSDLLQDTNYALTIQNFQRLFYCCGLDTPNDWFDRDFGNGSLGHDAYPVSCCAENQFDWNVPYKTCSVSQLTNYDGCFSSIQVFRYKIYIQMIFMMIILLLALLLTLACCLERDRCLQLARLINLQYAAHLSNCHQTASGINYLSCTGAAVSNNSNNIIMPEPIQSQPIPPIQSSISQAPSQGNIYRSLVS